MTTRNRTAALGIALFLASVVSAQTTRHVPSQYATIQAALDASNSGDIVLVGPGYYREHSMHFDEKNVVVRSSLGPYLTVIDAEGKGRHFTLNEGTIEGFTLTNGKAANGSAGSDATSGSFPDCDHAEASPGYVGGRGGSVLVSGYYAGTVTISSCIFSSNSAGAGGSGGAGNDANICNAFGWGNEGDDGGRGGDGGAICVFSPSSGTRETTVVNCLFIHNRAGNGGRGGDGGEGPVSGCPGLGGKGGNGGAIFSGDIWGSHSSSAPVDVVNCTFWDNRAGTGGVHGDGHLTTPSSCKPSTSQAADGDKGDVSAIVGVNFANVSWSNVPDDVLGNGSNPLFENAAAGNFSLDAASPFVDFTLPGSSPIPIPAVDLAGNPRVHDLVPGGLTLDAGAFETGPWSPFGNQANLYVEWGAGGTADGSLANPYPTIAQGAANIPAGQFLGVISGTYSESVLTLSNHMILKPLGGPVLIQ